MFYRSLLKYWIGVWLCPLTVSAQNTTGSISGFVKTITGERLAGATITLIHEPTGTRYFSQTRGAGIFNISNIHPGGPYSLEVSSLNYEKEKKTGIYVNLGEQLSVDMMLTPVSSRLKNVTVKSVRRTNGVADIKGIGTTIDRDKISLLPSAGNNLHDYLRAVPQAKLINGNEGAVSVAGQNNRFNSFYIDGALNNDVFGLAASGTNGGLGGISPLSIDAVNQFQVVITPYDASQGNFTGAGIHAVTRSGTNTTEGSVYYFFSNAGLSGKLPSGLNGEMKAMDGFAMNTLGYRLQGAITKNKVFYFINTEIQRDEYPKPFAFDDYKGTTQTLQTVNILANTLKSVYRYDAGSFLNNPEQIHASRIAMRFDWNPGSRHKLTISNRYTSGERRNTNSSTPGMIQFSNNGFLLLTNTHSASMELTSKTGRNAANKLLVTYTSVRDNRDPLGKPFPRVRINDGEGAFIFGTDNSSTINFLTQKNWTLFDKYDFTAGRHLISAGADMEYSSVFNSFIQNTFGNYSYFSLRDFLINGKPSDYQLGFPLIDNINSDQTKAAARFQFLKASLFMNDQVRASTHFTIQYGIRLDTYRFLTKPATDAYINDTAIPKFSAYYNLEGAHSGERIRLPAGFSPRIGFTYQLLEYGISLRGGMGIFSGRIPLAWPGGIYNNNGIFIGGYTANTQQLNNIRFRPDPYNQWTPAEVGAIINKAPVNLTTASFSMPEVFRASLLAEKKFREGWSLTLEAIISKNLHEIAYTNINLLPPIANVSGPDNRHIYTTDNKGRIPLNPNGSNPFDHVILLGNNRGKKGYAHTLTASINRRIRNGMTAEIHYTLGNSVIMNEGTSSVNLSQWRFMESVNGRNELTRSRSDFSIGHRIFALLSRKFQYAGKNMATSISIAYNGESGSPLSYVYGDNSLTRDDGVKGSNDLIYIPSKADLAGMAFLPYAAGNTIFTAQQQKDGLETYIQNNPYLKKHRGEYAERNGSRTPFTHVIDLKIKQDFVLKITHTYYRLQLTCDLFNLGNLINRNWGRRYFQPNDNYALIEFAGYANTGNFIPQYRFNPALLKSVPWVVSNSLSPAYSARWICQAGIRLLFN